MSITAECSACGRRYQAPASLAGKRVRCKQCGNIFQLPEAENPAEAGPNLDALAALEKSYHSMDATATGERPPDEQQDDESGGSPGALRSTRMNVRFDFPFAKELDQWLPLVLFIFGLSWLGKVGYDLQLGYTNEISWLAGVRVALGFLAFVGIIAPITLALIRSAGRRLGYRMPVGDRWRALACYLPAFALTYAMWVNSDGEIMGLALGALMGLLLGMAATWFLFRLHPSEIAPTALYAAVGYFVGLGICALLFFGLNLLAVNVLTNLKKPQFTPAVSPFGPGVAWVNMEQITPPTEVRHETTKPTAPDGNPVVTTVETPADGIIKNQRTAPIQQPFDAVIFPLTDSRFVATSRLGGGNTMIESWNTETLASAGSHPFGSAKAYVLSPDGDRLAMINEFPSPFVLVWSFRQNQALPSLYLENRPGTSSNPELIGFLSPRRLLTRWQRPGGYFFEVMDVETRAQVYTPMEVPNYDSSGMCLAINNNGSLAAIATKDPANGKPSILLYDLEKGSQIAKTEIGGFDARFPVSPTGMAFSFDSHKLAVLFEQGGNGLIKLYQVEPSGAIQYTTEYFYPAGPLPGRDLHAFTGNALSWTPDGSAWLLYGQGLFSSSTGKWLQEIDISGVERSRVRLPDSAILVAPAPPIPHQITVLQFDLSKVNALAAH